MKDTAAAASRHAAWRWTGAPLLVTGVALAMWSAALAGAGGSWLGGATLSSLELTVLRWVAELVGYPTDTAGILTSGGSMANLGGLAAARERAPERDGFRVYVSTEAHYSIAKAARVLGIPAGHVVTVAVDGEQRMRVDALAGELARARDQGIGPGVVCATAGAAATSTTRRGCSTGCVPPS